MEKRLNIIKYIGDNMKNIIYFTLTLCVLTGIFALTINFLHEKNKTTKEEHIPNDRNACNNNTLGWSHNE